MAVKRAKMRCLIYDSLYQIIDATHPTPPNPLEQFQYDAVGNRLGNGRIHNELNQLTEDDSCRYAYDADGNMTAKVSKQTGDSTVYTWDIENKLVEVRKPDMLARYTYDAFGRRMSKEVNGVKTQFRYDGQDLVLEMNGDSTITANYTFGPGIDNPLMMQRNAKNYYYVKDGLGSVTALTDSNATVVNEYKYSVFGEMLEKTGNVENPFTYTSREYDGETGNIFNRNRYYDPQIGLFTSVDPLGSGVDYNLYRYVWNNPTNWIDPYGLEIRLYTSQAWAGNVFFEDVGAQHVSLFSTEEDLWFQRTGSSWLASGENKSHFNDPYVVIHDLGGLSEKDFVAKLKEYNWDEGPYIFFLNDCHTSVNKAVEHAGGKSPGSPLGRITIDERISDYFQSINEFILQNVYKVPRF